MNISHNIRVIRKSKALTQQEPAARCNLSRTYIADIERGRYNPSLDALIAIANTLDISLSSLVDTDKQITTNSYTAKEEELISLYRLVPKNKQQIVFDLDKFPLRRVTSHLTL
jgi:transcriptional regulator with XRE-family HTH domain